jgi:hypothetical protein
MGKVVHGGLGAVLESIKAGTEAKCKRKSLESTQCAGFCSVTRPTTRSISRPPIKPNGAMK